MSFPDTRQSFVERLACEGSEEDWRCFLQDYWGPVCRFALRWGAGNLNDAEDVASQTFEVLWENRLPARWVATPAARFRSLLCGVVRRILANRRRVEANRQRIAAEIRDFLTGPDESVDDPADPFYMAWAEALLQRAMESLAAEYCRHGQGDYVRVLYGRLCQGLTLAEVAETLQLTTAAADHCFRDARALLTRKLQGEVRRHVERYSPPDQAEQDYVQEWAFLGQRLAEHGGLEEAVRRAYDLLDPVTARTRQSSAVNQTLTRLTAIGPAPHGAAPSPTAD